MRRMTINALALALIIAVAPVATAEPPTADPSPGCTAVNDPSYDSYYTSEWIWMPFNAGEQLRVTAGAPDTVTYGAAVQLWLSGGQFHSTSFPGTLEVTVPETRYYSLRWEVRHFIGISAQATWEVECMPPPREPGSTAATGNEVLRLEVEPGVPEVFAGAHGNALLVGYYVDKDNPHWDELFQIWLNVQGLPCLEYDELGGLVSPDEANDLSYALYATTPTRGTVLLRYFDSACPGGHANPVYWDSTSTAIDTMFDEDITVEIRIVNGGGGPLNHLVVMRGTIDR